MQVLTYRKPHNIPTTRGKKPCFLDSIKDKLPRQNHPEYGLLNRLDNQTCGLLFFAPDKKTYEEYKNLQNQHKVQKIYLAEVYGKVKPLFFWVSVPIAHHRYSKEKMVCVREKEEKPKKYRGKLHYVTTYCEQLEYNATTNTTFLEVIITKGIRHQIRCHLAHIGHSIVNDVLYTPKKIQKKLIKQGIFDPQGNLQLMSVGIRVIQ